MPNAQMDGFLKRLTKSKPGTTPDGRIPPGHRYFKGQTFFLKKKKRPKIINFLGFIQVTSKCTHADLLSYVF